MSYFKEVKIDTNNATGDAFGRVRTSIPVALFDSKQIHDNAELYFDDAETSGSGTTSSWSQNTASTTIGVSNTTAGTRIRQSYQRFNYQAGKSQQVLITGVLDKSGGGTDIIRRMGYFDDKNGIYLEDNAGTYNICKRTYVTGSAVNTTIAQSNWNIDTMDGTGPSGVTLDFSKSQILVIDFEWLGVGRVRVGFNIDGVTYVAHEFYHANTISGVYMSTPNLPIRYEIINGGTGAASTLEHICSSVISEGGQSDLGTVRSTIATGPTNLDTGSTYAIIGIRLKTANIDSIVDILNTSMILSSANDQGRWSLVLNPTIAGTFTYADETSSVVQTAKGTGLATVTGGILFDSGHFTSNNTANNKLDSKLILGSAIDGTRDEIVLCYTPLINDNQILQASMTWREI